MADMRATAKMAGGDLLEELRNQVEGTGTSLSALDDVKDYIGERIESLSKGINEPNFDETLTIAAVNVVQKAAGRAVMEAEIIDQQLIAAAKTALRVASRILAVIAAA